MKRIVKIVISVVCFIVAAPIVSFIAYDLIVIRPHLAEVKSLIERASPDERQPSQELCALLDAALISNLAGAVSRVIDQQFPNNLPTEPRNFQILKPIEWWVFANLHLSKEEQMTLYLSRSYMGKRAYGFSAAAMTFYSRSLNKLTFEQLATLVAISRAPSAYLNNPERLNRYRDSLLERVSLNRKVLPMTTP